MKRFFITLLIVTCSLFIACNNLFDLPETKPGYGTVTINFAHGITPSVTPTSARTLYPDPIMPDGSEFVYTFTPVDNNGEPTGDPLPLTPVNGVFTLAVGRYIVEVEVSLGTTPELVASGVSDPFNVAQGNNPTVDVYLTPAEDGKGTFTYSITFPEGATADLKLQRFIVASLEFGEPIVFTDTTSTNTTEDGTVTELTAGTYRFEVLLSKNGQSAGHSEAVYIVNGLTTHYGKTFTSLIDDGGSGAVTLKSIAEVETYLTGKTGTADEPVPLNVAIDLGNLREGSGWRQLLAFIQSWDGYVDLDLTRCTMDPALEGSFKPGQHNNNGNIVSLILPDIVTSIGNYAN
jgi:hypothetical protein